jgi:uncharacterized protein
VNATVRKVLRGLGLLVLLPYAAAIAYFVINETSMVFVGAGPTDSSGVPGEDAGFPWDSLRVQASDGTDTFLLESRLEDSQDAPWVMFFHGNGMLVARSNGRYELLREAGFNVLAVEYTGYGSARGTGAVSEEAVYLDVLAGYRYLTDTLGVLPENIVVYGFSLGSGPATYMAAETEVAGIITEGAFTSVPDLGAEIYPWLPIRLFARTGFGNLQRARTIEKPWLMLHGRNDEMVPFSHGEALAGVAIDARFVPMNSGHNDGVMANREVSLGVISEFLREVVGG